MKPYYEDDLVTLYHGDCREVTEWLEADVLVTDPPYGETSLAWDSWPLGWPSLMATIPGLDSMWCFGSMRMFLDRRDEFTAEWKLAQDVVWSKPRGRSVTTDRFSRSHEHVLHWYRGKWGDLHREPPRIAYHGAPVRATRAGQVNDGSKVKPIAGRGVYEDDGTRLMTTVLTGDAGDPRVIQHPTQKPLTVLQPIIRYSCPADGVVLDPFAGSGSTLVATKQLGRRAIGVELEERYCEIAAKRLAQDTLFGEVTA